jgi:hypothetical protein
MRPGLIESHGAAERSYIDGDAFPERVRSETTGELGVVLLGHGHPA